MTNHFNHLTEAEQERLAILMEECAEVIKICGKVLRHGYDSTHPSHKEGRNNRGELMFELGHVMCAVDRLTQAGDLHSHIILQHSRKKWDSARANSFLHHQRLEGVVWDSEPLESKP